jgi:hypothetical protein
VANRHSVTEEGVEGRATLRGGRPPQGRMPVDECHFVTSSPPQNDRREKTQSWTDDGDGIVVRSESRSSDGGVDAQAGPDELGTEDGSTQGEP